MLHILHCSCSTALVTDVTCSPHVVLRLLVIDQHLTILAIPVRFLVGDLHDCKDRVALLEYDVHLLQRAVGGFRVEEIDHGDNEGVDDGEDDICLISNGTEANC